jgi:putative ABC transport system permease protein
MPADARLVAGRWWPEDYRGPPIISLDAKVAKGFGVGVGGTLTVNVLGREITAEIASLREIDWRSLRFDFAIIFAPGALEGAPFTHIAAVRAKPDAEAPIERVVAERFVNVSTIRVREALEAAAKILEGVGAAVRGTASITIVAGALVLAGTIVATRRRRLYDAVVFKVLGATRARLLRAFLLEFGVLGLAAGAIAIGVGTATAWAVVVFLMESDWAFLPLTAAATLLGAIAVTVVAGFAGTWRALAVKAAPYLRNE